MISPPASSEYPAYYDGYVQKVYSMDVLRVLEEQAEEISSLTSDLDESTALYSYAAGKWTIKEVLGHITDTEQIFAYRLLRFVRGDDTPLSGFDQNVYIENASFNEIPISSLSTHFALHRKANLPLYRSISEEASRFRGMMNGNTVTVRGLLYIIAGHAAHHLAILKERYGLSPTV